MSSFASSDFDFFSHNFITSAKFPLDYSGFKYPWGKTKLLSDVEPKAGLESFYPKYSNNHQRTLELCPIRISRLVLIRGPCRVVTGGLCRRLVVTGGLCRRLVVTRGLFRRLVVTRGLCRRWNRKTFSFQQILQNQSVSLQLKIERTKHKQNQGCMIFHKTSHTQFEMQVYYIIVYFMLPISLLCPPYHYLLHLCLLLFTPLFPLFSVFRLDV